MYIIIIPFLIVLTWQDIHTKKINLLLCIAVMIFEVIFNITMGFRSIPSMLMGMGVGFFLILLSIITNHAVGRGDGIVLMLTGLAVGGINNFEILIFSLFLSSITGYIYLFSNKCDKNKKIAFIPYISIGYFLVCFVI